MEVVVVAGCGRGRVKYCCKVVGVVGMGVSYHNLLPGKCIGFCIGDLG